MWFGNESSRSVLWVILIGVTICGDACAVCLFEPEDGESVRRLPCSHLYHAHCIEAWAARNNRCPLYYVEPRLAGGGPPPPPGLAAALGLPGRGEGGGVE
ncbi:hypothetical protein I4F81_007452 [Pyropia yezoensis]|uniref:Uncharacterized protein n=1 Tax=Pyropia yezoensis TaxID=2788 RepID=A0ACC3C3N0_PYRYE|nr:hypothetical protein I4F81_007452 [Neopyropia yezoensis]